MGIYHRDEEREAQDLGIEQVLAKSLAADAHDLDIEKKWLQLTKIDKEQFSFFFDKYHDRIFKYVFLRTGDHDLAGELTGEVFTRAWLRIGRFTWQGYSFGAWLFQIARWVISHQLRQIKRRRETEFIPDFHDGMAQGDPETDYLADRDRKLVRMCVTKLPPVFQDVLVLHYWMGMTMVEVGLVMKIPVGTVSSNLRRGRKMLARLLLKQGFAEGMSPVARRIVEGQDREDSGLRVVDCDGENGSEK